MSTATLTPAQPDLARIAECLAAQLPAGTQVVITPERYVGVVIGTNPVFSSRVIVRRFDPRTWQRLVDGAYSVEVLVAVEVKTAPAANAAEAA